MNSKIQRADDRDYINSKIGYCYASLKNFQESVKYYQGNNAEKPSQKTII